MTPRTYRETFAPIIAAVLKPLVDAQATVKQKRRALRIARRDRFGYGFSPYQLRIWRDEVRCQIGLRPRRRRRGKRLRDAAGQKRFGFSDGN